MRGDRRDPSYVDMSEPDYESIIDTEDYYVMPNPPAPPTSSLERDVPSTPTRRKRGIPPTPISAERSVIPTPPTSTEREHTVSYDNVKDETAYVDTDVNEARIGRNQKQDR